MSSNRTERDYVVLATVQAWVEAVNERDVARVLACSDPAIEIIGPRGAGYGHALLRQWLGHARVHLETRRVFTRGDRVVVAQKGTWFSIETGDAIGEADVASYFQVKGGRVVRYERFDNEKEAVEAAGLRETDLVSGF